MTQFERLKRAYPCTSPVFTALLTDDNGCYLDEWHGTIDNIIKALDEHPGSYVVHQFHKKASWGMTFGKVVTISRKALEQYAKYLHDFWKE